MPASRAIGFSDNRALQACAPPSNRSLEPRTRQALLLLNRGAFFGLGPRSTNHGGLEPRTRPTNPLPNQGPFFGRGPHSTSNGSLEPRTRQAIPVPYLGPFFARSPYSMATGALSPNPGQPSASETGSPHEPRRCQDSGWVGLLLRDQRFFVVSKPVPIFFRKKKRTMV